VVFETLKVGGILTNCYVLADKGPEALVIDAGAEPERIIALLESKSLEPAMLLVTHGHADHIEGNAALKARYPRMQIAIGRDDADGLVSARKNLSIFVGMNITSPPADRLLTEGDVISVGGIALRVIETPGHSPGSVSLYIDDLDGAPALFSGDVLFARSIGRYDIAGGDWPTLERTIREKLFTLDDNTVVYPGHGPATTIGEEKRSNPFVGSTAV
jgi:glyoxylase-like metal-dependent hydrolase (beta-lactamase superfamily II)